MLTFETSQLQGARDIVEKLASLPFKRLHTEFPLWMLNLLLQMVTF